MKKEIEENICLEFGCSECCNPVKISRGMGAIFERGNLFIKLDMILVPESHPDSVKLVSFSCNNFDSCSGLCRDYFNRPKICRNTKCLAFNATNRGIQAEIVRNIKAEKFINIPFFKKETRDG